MKTSANRYFVRYNGETKTIREWSEILNIKYDTLINRINVAKWSIDKAFNTPVLKGKLYTYKGEEKTLSQWAKMYNLPRDVVKGRIRLGWEIERTLTTKYKKGNSRIFLKYLDVSKSLIDWSIELNISSQTLRNRLYKGWSIEKAIEEKVNNFVIYIEHKGKKIKLKEYAKLFNIDYKTLYARLYIETKNKVVKNNIIILEDRKG